MKYIIRAIFLLILITFSLIYMLVSEYVLNESLGYIGV